MHITTMCIYGGYTTEPQRTFAAYPVAYPAQQDLRASYTPLVTYLGSIVFYHITGQGINFPAGCTHTSETIPRQS